MIARHYSPPAPPRERGREFGAAHAAAIALTAQKYQRLFEAVAASKPDCAALGREALAAIARHAPASASEIEGIAEGAGLPAESVAMLNARTEILGRLRAQPPGPGPGPRPTGRPGEARPACSCTPIISSRPKPHHRTRRSGSVLTRSSASTSCSAAWPGGPGMIPARCWPRWSATAAAPDPSAATLIRPRDSVSVMRRWRPCRWTSGAAR